MADDKPLIVLTRPWPKPVLAALKEDYRLALAHPPSAKGILSALEGAAAFCPAFSDPVDGELIAKFPETVRLIASYGVGVDHIDLAAAKQKRLVVTNTPEVVSEDTADLTIGLMIAVMRGFSRGEALVRARRWRGTGTEGFLGAKVSGKTLGIVGLGRIGWLVAGRARGFGMTILYHGRNRKPEADKETGVVFCPSLEDMVGRCDVVSLHCPLTDETRHLIDAALLKKFKPGSYLINTGRGGLVDEAALVAALENGPLAGAGLDVYAFEPKLADGLAKLENVTLLPHIGTATEETRVAMGLRVKENLDLFFAGKPVRDQVALP